MDKNCLRFRAAWAKYKDLVYCVGFKSAPKMHDAFDHTAVAVFDEQEKKHWDTDSFETYILVDVTAFKTKKMTKPSFVALDERGYAYVQNDDIVEEIADSGLTRKMSKNYGALIRVRPIDETLYVVGMNGQILRRKKLNTWEHFDEGLLEKKKTKDPLFLCDIAMCPQETFYVIDFSRGAIFARKKTDKKWTELENPSKKALLEIGIDDKGTVLIGGEDGTLLKGNFDDGFKVVKTGITESITSLTYFDDQWILASDDGLHSYDGKKLKPYSINVKPAARSFHRVQSVEGVLWSFGKDDILRYDGKKWKRFLPEGVVPHKKS